MATVFDLDYADGLGRPDFSLYVFDSQGRLILMGLDSNIAEDRINSSGGSQVAGGAPAQLMNDPNTPVFDSVVPYNLGDVVLFVSQSTGYATNTRSTLATVNPFTGFQTSRNGSFAAQHRDIAMRPDGQLFTYSTGPLSGTATQGNIGNFLFVDTGTAQTTNLGDDGIQTFWRDGAGNVANAGNSGYVFAAMAFSGNTSTNLYAVGYRTGQQHPFNPATYRENVLFRFHAENGAVDGVGNNREGDARADQGAGTVEREIGQVRWFNSDTNLYEPLPARITGMEFVGGGRSRRAAWVLVLCPFR